MIEKRNGFALVAALSLLFGVLILASKFGNAGFVEIAYGGSTVSSTVVVGNAAPTVSSVNINGNNPPTITLSANTTTNVNVEATISDNNGCGDVNNGTTTILLYRSGYTSSTCMANPTNSLDCYVATAFTASSTCSTTNINTTTTFAVQYFARATDGSSAFPSNNWQATVIFKDPSNATGSLDSTSVSSTNDFATTIALNITTSSINYGILGPNTTSTNQTTTIANAGNSSSSLQLSASTILTSGLNTIAAAQQHFATSSSFSYGVSDTALSTSTQSVSGFLLTSPTSTTNVQSGVYWALQVPNGTATGTYSGVNQFIAVFSS